VCSITYRKRIWKTAVLCSVLQPPSIRELATPSSIAGWHYRRTSQLALCRTRYYHLRVSDNFALSTLVQSMTVKAARTNRRCGVYFMQFAAVCRTLYTAQTSVCTECHCTTDHWHAAQRSYLAGITRTSLTTHPRARQIQSGMPGSPVASLLGRRLPSHVRQHSALYQSICSSWRFDLRGAANTQQLWRQSLCSRGTSPVSVKLSSVQLRNPDITYGLLRRQLDVLSPFIPVLCHSDWLFHGESCPRLDVVHPGRAWSSSPTCTPAHGREIVN